MIRDKALSMIGMAKKAGKIHSGAFLVEKAIQTGTARLVILAGDASANTSKRFHDKCGYYKIPILPYADSAALGNSIGSGPRMVVSIDDEGFAAALTRLLPDRNGPPD